MAEKLFPHRQRCKTCGRKLGDGRDPVYLGMYDTARCAGIAEPVDDPQRAPRECVTSRDGQTVFKVRYRSRSEVPDLRLNDPSTSLYRCGHCAHLHLGHSRMGTSEQFRMLASPKELSEVLVKLRGAATRKQVAEAAGVRPIRLKELEEGADRVDLDALFKVLSVLRARPGLAIGATRVSG